MTHPDAPFQEKSSVRPSEKKPTPVGLGARKEGDEDGDDGVDAHGALDRPAVPPPPADE